MRTTYIKHLSLPKMARQMIHENAAADIVPVPQVITTEAYLELVVEALRKERLELTDSQFRQKYSRFLA